MVTISGITTGITCVPCALAMTVNGKARKGRMDKPKAVSGLEIMEAGNKNGPEE
jgi:hypothetical protein